MRLEIRPSNGLSYVVVVADVLVEGKWKKKTVKSLGNADRGPTWVRASGWCHATGWNGLNGLREKYTGRGQ